MSDDVQLINPTEREMKVAARFRTFLILWIAMLASIGFLFALASLVRTPAKPNSTLTYVLTGTALVSVVASLAIKFQKVRQAIDKHDIGALMSAYIVGFALSEAAALFGMLEHFNTGSSFFRFSF